MAKKTAQEDGFAFKSVVSNLLILVFCLIVLRISFDKRNNSSYRSGITSDIKNAYTAAQAYFTDYPDATVDLGKLVRVGFRPHEGVKLLILSGKQETLEMATYYVDNGHCLGLWKKVNAEGAISTFDPSSSFFGNGDQPQGKDSRTRQRNPHPSGPGKKKPFLH